MEMTNYIRAVKCGLRDQHGFKPRRGSDGKDPTFSSVPDGTYPMTIQGKVDRVRITSGKIFCCNWSGGWGRQ